MFKIMDSDEAVKLIHDGDVICLNSFEPEFDYLNSTEIQERINVIQWIPLNPSNLSLLSTNGCFLLLLVINR